MQPKQGSWTCQIGSSLNNLPLSLCLSSRQTQSLRGFLQPSEGPVDDATPIGAWSKLWVDESILSSCFDGCYDHQRRHCRFDMSIDPIPSMFLMLSRATISIESNTKSPNTTSSPLAIRPMPSPNLKKYLHIRSSRPLLGMNRPSLTETIPGAYVFWA